MERLAWLDFGKGELAQLDFMSNTSFSASLEQHSPPLRLWSGMEVGCSRLVSCSFLSFAHLKGLNSFISEWDLDELTVKVRLFLFTVCFSSVQALLVLIVK
jgi:hypothetical protein